MKITNFRDFRVKNEGSSKETYTANVDVTTGLLWWKSIKTVVVQRELGCPWFFVETGKFAPNTQMLALERSFLARKQ